MIFTMVNPHKTILFLFILSFTFFNGNAQELTDENTYIINQYFQLNKESSLFENNAKTTSNRLQSQNNFVSLNQVGNNNQIDIKQKGGDSQTVNQLGNNNYYNFINYYNNTPSNFNIVQQGNANNLQIYGENSIINNISIFQKSNFKTLIIKNY
ncbi:MAG: hypothetical protein HKP59_05045 [Lutibacter sp.]|uniref:hypothetical protein n=1 Tax=Lutibacter sp. TaxID=1925666 RepID=UPI00178F8EE7|nr:hypothetical protein [Lutibacter sp.]MBT8316969.1 hypothetical protein [Lutibacter sp.]NNJ57829.1 hypothetical protein [Lutibacter sp.]